MVIESSLAGDVQSESRPRPVSRLLSLKGSLGHDGGEQFQADFAPDQRNSEEPRHRACAGAPICRFSFDQPCRCLTVPLRNLQNSSLFD
jgi:hypothetical protein